MSRKQKQTDRKIAQVSSKSLIPPEEPDEVTEADVDFKKEEEDIAAQIKALKAKQAKLKKRKAQAVGGKKLARMRKFAEETTAWAQKAAAKFVTSVERANTAVGNLQEYEQKLGIEQKLGKSVATRLLEEGGLEEYTDAVETIRLASP
jgi:hypothetical protein